MTCYVLIEFKHCSTIKVISIIETFFFVIRVLFQTADVKGNYALYQCSCGYIQLVCQLNLYVGHTNSKFQKNRTI